MWADTDSRLLCDLRRNQCAAATQALGPDEGQLAGDIEKISKALQPIMDRMLDNLSQMERRMSEAQQQTETRVLERINMSQRQAEPDAGYKTEGAFSIQKPNASRLEQPRYANPASNPRVPSPPHSERVDENGNKNAQTPPRSLTALLTEGVELKKEDILDQRQSRTNRRHSEIDRKIKVVEQRIEKTVPLNLRQRIVMSPHFDVAIAVLVLMNCMLLGLQTNYEATASGNNAIFEVVEMAFAFIFAVELVLRFSLMGCTMFCSAKERFWSFFDTLLVTSSLLEFVLVHIASIGVDIDSDDLTIGKMLKVAKMARIMRLMRVFRFCEPMRLMILMIIGSMQSLFWLIVLLVSCIYTFAIVLTRGATDFLRPDGLGVPPLDHESFSYLDDMFGSMMRTSLTLFMSITGGENWGIPANHMQSVGTSYLLCFILYVFVCLFSVLQIVTGVFVDSAIQHAETDRGSLQAKNMERKSKLADELVELLVEVDTDKSGFISLQEFVAALHNENVCRVLAGLDIEIVNLGVIWDILDFNGDGMVQVREFVDGMLSFKGPAKSVDVQIIMAKLEVLLLQTQLLVDRAPGSKVSIEAMANGAANGATKGSEDPLQAH